MGSALGVGAAEKLRRVGCPLREAGAEAECVRGGEGDRVGLSEGRALATAVEDCVTLLVPEVEPPQSAPLAPSLKETAAVKPARTTL